MIGEPPFEAGGVITRVMLLFPPTGWARVGAPGGPAGVTAGAVIGVLGPV